MRKTIANLVLVSGGLLTVLLLFFTNYKSETHSDIQGWGLYFAFGVAIFSVAIFFIVKNDD